MVVLLWSRTLIFQLFMVSVLHATPKTVTMLVTEIGEYQMKTVLCLVKKRKRQPPSSLPIWVT